MLEANNEMYNNVIYINIKYYILFNLKIKYYLVQTVIAVELSNFFLRLYKYYKIAINLISIINVL